MIYDPSAKVLYIIVEGLYIMLYSWWSIGNINFRL